jgi:hypothetical protein
MAAPTARLLFLLGLGAHASGQLELPQAPDRSNWGELLSKSLPLLAPWASWGSHSVCFINSSMVGSFEQPTGWKLPPYSAGIWLPCDAGAFPAIVFGIGYQGEPVPLISVFLG